MPQSPSAAEHEHPREEEHGQRVEDDEDERDEVEADRELHPAVADRLGAALVALELGGERAARAAAARAAASDTTANATMKPR